jgi:hypothetical protein
MGQKKNNSIKGLPSFIPIEVGLGDWGFGDSNDFSSTDSSQ